MATEEREQKKRQRSPNYPAVGLREAVERVGKLYELDGKAGAPPEIAAKHIGFGTAHGQAMAVLSALKKFGLVAEDNGRIVPSQRAIEIIVLEPGDPRRTQALTQAVLSPHIYKQLIGEHRETGFPADDTLKRELVAYKRFNPKAVGSFVKDLKDSLEFAGLSDLAVLGLDLEEHGESNMELTASETSHGKPRLPEGAIGVPSKQPTQQQPVRDRSYAWALSGDFTAKLDLVGEPQSEEDLEALRDYVEITIKALGRSLKKARAAPSV